MREAPAFARWHHNDGGKGWPTSALGPGKENDRGKVRTGHSTSLDGFIAGPNDGLDAPMGEGGERLLGWYAAGNTEYRLPGTEMVFKVSAQTAELLARRAERQGHW